MKLYMFPVAPNPTRVRLYLAEKAALGCVIAVDQIVINLPAGEQKQPEHLARHPFGQLPVLETDAGTTLFDSTAIIEYFEDTHPTPSLYGEDAESRGLARQLERIADVGVLQPMGGAIHATNSPLGWPPNPEVAAYLREKLTPKLDYLESLLADGRPFLAGDNVSVGDCTLAASFQFARFREMDFLSDHAVLCRWDADYRKRATAESVLIG
jgi:glutathione S-transferase